MVNRLIETDNNLPKLDYSSLLQQILRVISQRNPAELFAFSGDQQRLIIKTEAIATLVAQANIGNPILGQEPSLRTASVNFSEEFRQKFPELILQIKQALQQKLETFLSGYNLTIPQLVDQLTTPLSGFQYSQATLNLSYPFSKSSPLEKQRLIIQQDGKGTQSSLKFHKVTITIHNTNQFEENLKQGLNNYFEQNQHKYEQEWDSIQDILERIPNEINNNTTDFYRLKKLVDTEFLGQLKREASLKYLEYIKANIDPEKHPDVYYLHNLIKRLDSINSYINDHEKSDANYKFYYQGVEIDLRQLLSRAEAFDCLPVIPIVEGYLGETTDKNNGKRQFIFGLKLKLNGKVQSQGKKSSFAYHMDLINPHSDTHKQELQTSNDKEKESFIRKVFKFFFLYYIVLTSRCKPGDERNPNPSYLPSQESEYNPFTNFESKALTILQGNDEEKKTNLLASFNQGLLKDDFKIEYKINRLVKLLKDFLKHGTILKTQEYSFHIGVHRAILENDQDVIVQRDTLFKEILRKNPKESLQYISMGQPNCNKDIICQLPASIKIEDIRYQATQETLKPNHTPTPENQGTYL